MGEEDHLAIKMVPSKVPCLAGRVKKLGSCGKQVHMEMCHCQMAWWSMPKPMKRSRVHSLPSRRMLIRSILDGRRSWATQANHPCKQQHLTGRKRQSHESITHFKDLSR